MHARGPDVGARHFLTFVLCVRCEGKGIGRDDQAPQFAQENSKHCNRQALVLRVIQEVDRAVGSSGWYLEATCYQAHTLTTLCIFHFIHPRPSEIERRTRGCSVFQYWAMPFYLHLTRRTKLKQKSVMESAVITKPHLSNPGRPLCVSPFFMRLDKIARISMTTSCKGKHASEFCLHSCVQLRIQLKSDSMPRKAKPPSLNHTPPTPPPPTSRGGGLNELSSVRISDHWAFTDL